MSKKHQKFKPNKTYIQNALSLENSIVPAADWQLITPDFTEAMQLTYQRLRMYLEPTTNWLQIYCLALLADVWQLIAWIIAKINRRKLILTSFTLLIVASSFGGYYSYKLAKTTLQKYRLVISSPATIMGNNRLGTIITDRNGTVLYRGYGATEQVIVPLTKLPKQFVRATLAAEDPHFYDHPGYSWKGTVRALWTDLRAGQKAQGGSTITQQLVKNTLLTPQKSYIRKFNELVLSIALEKRYSKDQILEMYVNKVYYGQGAYGILAASQTYFHKTPDTLNTAESALLAGLPLGPSKLDPTIHAEDALARRSTVLLQMQENHDLSAAQLKLASTAPLVVFAQVSTIKYPHFVFFVLDQLRQQYGDWAVEYGGITAQTSLDPAKQDIAEATVRAQIERLGSHHATNGGLVMLDPKNSRILAMVGSINYDQPDFGSVNVTTSKLQPGSSFKPIAYATAMKFGWNGATIIDDTPLRVLQSDGTWYQPHNYDGRFRGKISLRRALANSLNIPALRTIQFTGIEAVMQTAKDMGITGLNDISNYGISLVLGSAEIRPLDMANAYATLANGGVYNKADPILSVKDRNGLDIGLAKEPPKQVLDPRIAYMITQILADNTARTEEFGANSPLVISRVSAAKTGTTNDFRDNWTIGYTPNLVVAVWVGNNDHSPMENVDGITGAAPIWHDVMEKSLTSLPSLSFITPPGLAQANVCPYDGGLARKEDPKQLEWFKAEALPTKICQAPINPSYASIAHPPEPN